MKLVRIRNLHSASELKQIYKDFHYNYERRVIGSDCFNIFQQYSITDPRLYLKRALSRGFAVTVHCLSSA
jgi:hypothetical protein